MKKHQRLENQARLHSKKAENQTEFTRKAIGLITALGALSLFLGTGITLSMLFGLFSPAERTAISMWLLLLTCTTISSIIFFILLILATFAFIR